MLKNINILLTVLVLFPIMVSIAACEPPSSPPRTFKDLIENKAQGVYGIFTDGAVAYVTEKDGWEFFVATYPGISRERITSDFIVAKSPKRLAIGDIVSVEGEVKEVTGPGIGSRKLATIVYYLDVKNLTKTGRVDITNPNFEELIRIVNEEIQRENSAMFITFMIIYYRFFFSPFK